MPKSHPVHAFRQRVALAARAAGLTKTDTPVTVIIEARFKRPQSHFRKSGIKPTAPPLPRPDCDNLAKAVLDALQDVMGDDTKVARLIVVKNWGAEAFTEVAVVPEQPSGSGELGREQLREVLGKKVDAKARTP